jgi:hypothetical protein
MDRPAAAGRPSVLVPWIWLFVFSVCSSPPVACGCWSIVAGAAGVSGVRWAVRLRGSAFSRFRGAGLPQSAADPGLLVRRVSNDFWDGFLCS